MKSRLILPRSMPEAVSYFRKKKGSHLVNMYLK